MALLTGIIPPQNFEVVRDRIGEVLADEIANQVTLTTNELINAEVWIERVVPFDSTELPVVNVALNRGDYSNKDQTQTDGSYSFYVDVYAGAISMEDPEDENKVINGDYLAKIAMQKILGICRAILENPRYRTLAYEHPFCKSVKVTSLEIGEVKMDDTNSVAMGRLTVSVEVPEYVALVDPVTMAGYVTQVKLYETDKGYFYGLQDAPEDELTDEEGDAFENENDIDSIIPET